MLVSSRWRPTFCRITRRHKSINGSGSAKMGKKEKLINQSIGQLNKVVDISDWNCTLAIRQIFKRHKRQATAKQHVLCVRMRAHIRDHAIHSNRADVITHCLKNVYLELWKQSKTDFCEAKKRAIQIFSFVFKFQWFSCDFSSLLAAIECDAKIHRECSFSHRRALPFYV